MTCAGDYCQGCEGLRQAFVEQLSAATGNDFVVLRGEEKRGDGDMRRVAPGFVFVEQQPAHGKVREASGGEFLDAVVRGHENEPIHGPKACNMNGDTAAEAAPNDDDVGAAL